MRTRLSSFSLFFLLGFLLVRGSATAGAPPPRLYALKSEARPSVGRVVHDAVEEYSVQLDPATINANPEALDIQLPGHGPLEAVRTRFVVYKPDWKSWTGTLRYVGSGGAGTGFIHIGYHGDQLTALIVFEGERYRIVRVPGDGHRLFRLSDDLSPRSCAVEDSGDTEPMPLFDKTLAGGAKASESQTKATSNRIDLLVVYPRGLFQFSTEESMLPIFVRDSVSLANTAFANSNVSAEYNLVGVVPLTGAQPGSAGLIDGLNFLDTNPTPAEVTALRTAFGADVVVLFLPWEWSNPDACGYANLPQHSGNLIGGTGAFNGRAFSAQRYDCGQQDFTLAHEIGHNFSMHHHFDQVPDLDPLYANSLGYVFQVGQQSLASVMACFCTGCFCLPVADPGHCPLGHGAVCNRVPFFSDPAINYPNTQVPVGTAERNNANVGRLQAATVAGYVNPATISPPTPSFTVSCPNLTCTFNGSGSYDANGWITNWWWDFGDGQTTTGSASSHPYANAGSLQVHMVVTDNQGQTAVTWRTASPHVPVYEGYHEVANCRSVSGWAWDQVTPNTPINVDLYRDSSLAATTPANLYRSDLYWAGKGNGYHAFVYTPPWWWADGQWHYIYARYGGTATNLYWSPIRVICGVSMFPIPTPSDPDLSTGGQVYTVGTQFSSSINGYVTQLGFFRAPSESGTDTLRLWTDGGAQLASVTPYCGGSGWCWGDIPDVAISAGTRYRVTVNTNYAQAKTGCGIGSGITNQNLTAHSGYWVAGDTFPTNGSCSNFFVDIKFDQ